MKSRSGTSRNGNPGTLRARISIRGRWYSGQAFTMGVPLPLPDPKPSLPGCDLRVSGYYDHRNPAGSAAEIFGTEHPFVRFLWFIWSSPQNCTHNPCRQLPEPAWQTMKNLIISHPDSAPVLSSTAAPAPFPAHGTPVRSCTMHISAANAPEAGKVFHLTRIHRPGQTPSHPYEPLS
jgi:hypothetical protein